MATKKTTRKTTSSRGKKPASAKSRAAAASQARKRLWAIILFAVGLMLLFVAAIPGEKAWLSLHEWLLGCFSWCAYILGPIVIYTAVMIDIDKTDYPIAAKVISSAVLIMLFCGASQIFSQALPEGKLLEIVGELYEQGKELTGGGVLGIMFGVPLLNMLDFTGAAITIVVLIFVAIMILSGGSIAGLIRKTFVHPVRKMEEAYVSASENRAQLAEEAEQRRRDRMSELGSSAVFLATKDARTGKVETRQVTAEDEKKKLLEAARSMDKPVDGRAKPAKPAPVAEVNDAFFDIDAHTPTETARPEPTPPPRPAPKPKPEPKPEPVPAPKLDDPVTIFGIEEEKPTLEEPEMSIDEIISRAIADEPVVDSGNGMLNFGGVVETAPTTEVTAPAVVAPAVTSATGEVIKPEYTYPPVSLLREGKNLPKGDTTKELKANADRLVDTLKSFGVQTRIVDISRGPAVTRYELQPSAGVKISRITNLADDIALNLAAAGVRIEAPIPNKAAIGIEVPNKIVAAVPIREILDSDEFRDSTSKLTVALGKDITGNLSFADLGKMPHLLIAGATGSGKSVCINSLITSLLFKASPDEVKLLMIDPKVVELGGYNGIPHLLSPVVTDPKKAAGALCTMVGEMLRRYKLFADNNVRDLAAFNKVAQLRDDLEAVPHIVIIIDELADLMMASPKDVEDYICRLAQMARAAGMHLVIATQRPSVDVITGVIKANIPSRISFAVSSQIDSRTILDMGGAEKLLGRGDMLYYPVGSSKPTRVQGCFVTDGEVEKVVDFIKGSSSSNYDEQLMEDIEKNAAQVSGKGGGSRAGSSDSDDDADELLDAAIEVVVEAGQASTSLLQRRLKVGYARAARLVDEMEQRGIVGPFEGSKPRQVMISKERLYEMKMNKAN